MASTPLNLSGMFENSPAAAPRSRERVENIPVDLIDSHPRNTTYVTETMLDPAFRESVAAFGVLQPVLVIPNDNAAGRYYLLAGHKRLLGSRLCGRSYIPAIIRKGLPPGLEGIYITDTNLQYGVQNMLPSEKCRTLWEQHQSLKEFRQYCRTHAEEKQEIELGGKVFKFGHLEKTRETLATAYGLTPTDVQRFLGLHTLSPVLFECVDRRTLAISAATYLAQLPKEWQLEAARWIPDKKISAYQAQQILFLYQNGGNEKGIKDIVQNTQNDSRHKITGSYKISRRMLKSYSPYLAAMNDDEIALILKAALTLYFESHPLENSEQRGYNISEEAV